MTHTDPQHGRGVSRSDPARALDEIAAQQRLLRSVTALEEPLRSTLLRRHHHGLTVEEIAHADGVPPATVRARLRRAHELLDEEWNDRDENGNRIGLPLVAFWDSARRFARDRRAWFGNARVAPWITWSLGVTALVVVLFSPFGPLRFGADRGRGAAVSAASREADEGVAGARVGPVATGARSNAVAIAPPIAAEEPASNAEVRVHARFVDEDRHTIGGARLLLVESITGRPVEGGPSKSSDPDGEVELGLDPSRQSHPSEFDRAVQFVLRAEAHRRAPRELSVFAIPGDRVELGDILLPRAGVVTGRVLDPDGRPLVNTEVRLTHPDLDADEQTRFPDLLPALHQVLLAGWTDAEGRFRFEGIAPGTYRAWALPPRFLGRASHAIEVRAEEETRTEDLIVQSPETEHCGVVVDEHGAPVYRARVDRRHDGVWELIGFTDTEGRFQVELDRSGLDDLHVWAPRGEAGAVLCLGVEATSKEGRYVLPAARAARFLVRDAEGRPVVGAQWKQTYDEFLEIDSGTSADGAISLARPAVYFGLRVTAPGHATRTWRFTSPERLEEETVLVLETAPTLRGRVDDARGAPIGDALVQLWRLAAPDTLERTTHFPQRFDSTVEWERVTTAADGTFEFTLRGSETRALTVAFGQRIAHVEEPIDPRDAGTFHVLRLAEPGVLVGRLLLPVGVPRTGQWVGICFGDQIVHAQCVGANGTFRFEGLAPGRWWIHRLVGDVVGRPGRAPLRPPARTVEIEAGRTTTFVLDLRNEQPAHVVGKFTMPGVEPRGWSAMFTANEAESWSRPHAHLLDAKGGFDLDDLEPGRGTLVLVDTCDREVRREVRMPIELDSGPRELQVDVPTARLSLRARGGAHGLAITGRGSRGVSVITRLSASALSKPIELVVPATRLELHALDARGAVLDPVLGEVDATAGTRVELDAVDR